MQKVEEMQMQQMRRNKRKVGTREGTSIDYIRELAQDRGTWEKFIGGISTVRSIRILINNKKNKIFLTILHCSKITCSSTYCPLQDILKFY